MPSRRRADPPASVADPLERIYATVDSIPRGRVATYGQVAEEAGLPRRWRLVGRALRELAEGSRIPWHRVVNASGAISDRGRPEVESEQAVRLRREGVEVDERGRVSLATYRWEPAP